MGVARCTVLRLMLLAAALVAASSLRVGAADACDSPAELHAALLEHDKARIEFQFKMQTGYIRRAKKGDLTIAAERNRLLYAGPDRTLAAIRSHLKAMDASERTLALVYDPRATSDCVWLITPHALHGVRRGLEGRAVEAGRFAAGRFRQVLNVDTRMAARLPRSRAPSRTLSPLPQPPLDDAQRMTEAHVLRREIIPDTLLDILARSADSILVLPVGDLSAVPFSALPLREPGQAVVDVASVVVLPSVDGLFFWVPVAPFSAFRDALIVGDPDLSADPVYEFQPLPGARVEAEAIASLTRTLALIGDHATHENVSQRLRAAPQLIYFATHGIANERNPMDGSFLALRGRHLSGAEIKKLAYHSRHPLVVMSACQTGLGKSFNAGIFGLARAWIHAGAAQVVASQWNVADDATSALMISFLTAASRGTPTASALRQAMIETRTRYPDPALWGSFNLIGYAQPQP